MEEQTEIVFHEWFGQERLKFLGLIFKSTENVQL